VRKQHGLGEASCCQLDGTTAAAWVLVSPHRVGSKRSCPSDPSEWHMTRVAPVRAAMLRRRVRCALSVPFSAFNVIVRAGTVCSCSERLSVPVLQHSLGFRARGRRVRLRVSSVPFSIFHVIFRAGTMFLCPQVLRTRFQDAFLRRLGGLEPLPDAWDLISAPRRIASARADLRRHSFSPLPPAGAALRPLSLPVRP
jgi:hypothetical protein